MNSSSCLILEPLCDQTRTVPDKPTAPGSDAQSGLFPATPWSQLMRLRVDDESARQALARVCELYWYPVYAYIRSRGHSPHDAEDLAQGFFMGIIRREDLSSVDQRDGKLRNFLLASIKNYLANSFRDSQRLKRGGGREFISLDVEWAEGRLQNDLSQAAADPEREFEQRWAVTLLEHVLRELESEYEKAGRRNVFACLGAFLSFSVEPPSYEHAARALGITEQNARVAVHRMRKRYRDLLQKHIEATVDSPDEADAELDHLLRVFSTDG
ncbi:MAG: sigma-70 family RNA polymerase sigma factor [Verrucomicrobiaceae bacterium]|nr:sigma-70 family RNA polymerase sigma factor [Verrucomicrobiaceae bacterium]